MKYEVLNYRFQSPYDMVMCPDCYSQDVVNVPRVFESRYKCNKCKAKLRKYVSSYVAEEMKVEVIERR